MIISAFPACGKTYLYKNQDILQFSYLGERRQFTFCDSDSSKYEKKDGWVQKYIDDLEQKLGTVDFLFISQHEEVLQELSERGIPFVMVAPDNSAYLTDKERQLIKQQWFGRFLLRDNSHIKDFNAWLKLLKEHYDEWTNDNHLLKHDPVSFFLLKGDQYLGDIIEDLYWKKEKCDIYIKTNSTPAIIKEYEIDEHDIDF